MADERATRGPRFGTGPPGLRLGGSPPAAAVASEAPEPGGDGAGPVEVQLEPALESVSEARGVVRITLREWGLAADLESDAAVVVSELATNAVLHARTPYSVAIRRHRGGVRIEVTDACAEPVLPVLPDPPVPSGVLEDPAEMAALQDVLGQTATTGRGMWLVTSLSAGWGVVTWNGGKTVWADLATDVDADGSVSRQAPELPPVEWPEDGVEVRIIAVPVRLVIDGDRQLDDIEREVQVLAGGTSTTGWVAALVAAMEAARVGTSLIRVAARHAIREALQRGDRLIDLSLRADDALVAGFDGVAELLRQVAEESRADRLLVGLPSEETSRFGLWLRTEVEAQMGGRAPLPCPFPTVPHAEEREDPATRLSAARRRELSELRQQLTATSDLFVAGSTLVRRAVQTLQGSRALLCLLGEDGETVKVVQQAAADRDVPLHRPSFPLGADLPMSEVIRTGHLVMLRTQAERDERYPALDALESLGDPAMVFLPLVGDTRGALGCLVLSFAESRTLTADQLSFLRQLAGAAGAWFDANLGANAP